MLQVASRVAMQTNGPNPNNQEVASLRMKAKVEKFFLAMYRTIFMVISDLLSTASSLHHYLFSFFLFEKRLQYFHLLVFVIVM